MPLVQPAMLSTADRQHVTTQLANLTSPVTLHAYTQSFGCEPCAPTMRLLKELPELSEHVTLTEHNLVLDKDAAAADGIERAPSIVVANGHRRVRFEGAPFGYEFASLLQAITLVSAGDSGLSDASRAQLAMLEEPLTIRVFSTPT